MCKYYPQKVFLHYERLTNNQKNTNNNKTKNCKYISTYSGPHQCSKSLKLAKVNKLCFDFSAWVILSEIKMSLFWKFMIGFDFEKGIKGELLEDILVKIYILELIWKKNSRKIFRGTFSGGHMSGGHMSGGHFQGEEIFYSV